MKIGIVTNLYPPFSIGGYEELCAKVSGELALFGHEIAVLTSTRGGVAPNPKGQVVERRLQLLANEDDIYSPLVASASEREAMNLRNVEELSGFRDRHRPDVWFVWNLFFLDETFYQRLSSYEEPVVLFLTDNWLAAARRPEEVQRFFANHVNGPEPFHPGVRLSSGASRKDRWAIFGSTFIKDLYHACGFSFDRSVVIHNGVELPINPPGLFVDRSEPREAGRLKLLFAGRVVDIKGPQLLIAALPLIKERAIGQVSVTIVGDAQDRAFAARLMEEIEASGCRDLISFREPVLEHALLPLFNDHDIYVFPSLYEPFSLTLIHALGAGIPTVATDVGGNVEIVEHGESGLLFNKASPTELAEAVLRLERDRELRTAISKRGRQLAERFTFRRMVTRIESELRKANA